MLKIRYEMHWCNISTYFNAIFNLYMYIFSFKNGTFFFFSGCTRTFRISRTCWSQRNACTYASCTVWNDFWPVQTKVNTEKGFGHCKSEIKGQLRCFPLILRDPKDPVVTRVRLESLVKEDRRDTEVSRVCRVSPDPR